jgi:cytochrome c oxidase assembly protein subunit 15
MEWGHRILGRVIGIVFVAPLAYFALRKKLTTSLSVKLTGLAALIGVQGILGWFMVKSGLEDTLLETPGAVPRVSQYRLAAHLGTAFVLFSGMLGTGLAIVKDWKFAHGGRWSGADAESWRRTLDNPLVRRFKGNAVALTALVFLTALSGTATIRSSHLVCSMIVTGAFVAGLDAGLLYNEFPLMGGRLIPPVEELYSPSYGKQIDGSDMWWRNIFENPTTVQFDHRVLVCLSCLLSNLYGWYLRNLDRLSRLILVAQFSTRVRSGHRYARSCLHWPG